MSQASVEVSALFASSKALAAAQQACTSPSDCLAWLSALPLGNPTLAQPMLLHQMELMNAESHISPAFRYEMLAMLRKPLELVQAERGRHFAFKPLPLAADQQSVFDTTLATWLAALEGYQRCLDGLTSTDDALANSGNLDFGKRHDFESADSEFHTSEPTKSYLIEQCVLFALALMNQVQIDYYRVARRLPVLHWQTMHDLYHFAEIAGIDLAKPIVIQREEQHEGSIRSLYAEALLLHALCPYDLSARELVWAARWAQRWSYKISIVGAPPVDSRSVTHLILDQNAPEPIRFDLLGGLSTQGALPRLHWLDTAGLRPSIKQRLALLEQGRPPVKLQLGDDCQQPACGELLKKAYRRWCKGGYNRRVVRQKVDVACGLQTNLANIYGLFSSTGPFRQPVGANDAALRKERELFATLDRSYASSPNDLHALANAGLSHANDSNKTDAAEFRIDINDWAVIDESPLGVQIKVAKENCQIALVREQLIAVWMMASGKRVLGAIRWLNERPDSYLYLGIRLFPGNPEAISVKHPNPENRSESYRPGFLLPAIPSIQLPRSIVLSPGIFKANRQVEVLHGNESRLIILNQLLEMGRDYEYASYDFC